MTRLRLVLVTRKFWPLVGDAESVMAGLAAELQQLGVQTTVVTAQWDRSWPRQMVYREVPVVLLPHAPRHGWGTLRYMYALSRWLRQHQSEIDVVCVSLLKHDAYAALGALRHTPVPVVLRCESGGSSGDCHWQETVAFGSRIKSRCQLADEFVAPDAFIADELRGAGYAIERTQTIANGVPIGPPRTPANRTTARAALAEAHPLLEVAEYSPLVVYAGPLEERMGLSELVRAWPAVADAWPGAKLWLVGEGTYDAKLWDQIKHRGLAEQAIMTGSFDELDGVLHAADLFVLPSHEEGTSPALLTAMAVGVPMLVTDSPGRRELLAGGELGRLVPPHDAHALGAAMIQTLKEPRSAASLAAGRRRIEQQFSTARMAAEHLQLFQRLLAAKQRKAS
jgi:glycosyltransferase involved in cell wall biosynthesis